MSWEDWQTETEDDDAAYHQVADDEAWQRVLTLAVGGDVLRHQRHPSQVPEGVQHKLFVWVCETRRPQAQCPCGLYRLRWLPTGEEP